MPYFNASLKINVMLALHDCTKLSISPHDISVKTIVCFLSNHHLIQLLIEISYLTNLKYLISIEVSASSIMQNLLMLIAEVVSFVYLSCVSLFCVFQRKLIVGHNMLLDLLHLIEKFCYPLPEV